MARRASLIRFSSQAQWRQAYFRPGKPLPKDVDFGGRIPPVQRRPFTLAVLDFVISCVCLGIPYIFLERARLAGSRSVDEESGLLRGPAPMLIIGACTCLMVSHLPALCSFARITQKKAAIVLSTSVTFLSLPGLDGITRTPAMVAILFAAFAIAASGVAVLRHKADLERPVSHIGVEGIVGVSVSRFLILFLRETDPFLLAETNYCSLTSSCFSGLCYYCIYRFSHVVFLPWQVCRKSVAEDCLRRLHQVDSGWSTWRTFGHSDHFFASSPSMRQTFSICHAIAKTKNYTFISLFVDIYFMLLLC